MKTTIVLELKTREVHHLFTRTINDKRLFMNAILHKLNKIAGLCRKQTLGAKEIYQNIEKSILTLTQQFSDETKQFQGVLGKKTSLGDKKITVSPTFYPKIVVENPLTMRLIELIKTYDNFVATLKLLYLAGYFESKQDYYANIRRIQKAVNQALSKIIA